MLDGEIRIEYYPMNPPKPTGFGVFVSGKHVAVLTYEQVRSALAIFDRMRPTSPPASPG